MPSCAPPTSLTATLPRKRTTSLAGASGAICRSESKKRFLAKTQNASFIFSGNVDDCVNVKGKKIRPRGPLKYLWNHPDLSRTTKEKIAYHNGKEFFRLNRAGSAHAPRKANNKKNYLRHPRAAKAIRLGKQRLSDRL